MEKSSKSRAQYRVAVDVGGTFIDYVLLDEVTGEVRTEKTSSVPQDLPGQFLAGLRTLNAPIESNQKIFHGMTVGVNALVQEKGARVGLITTQGFRDVLEIGRGGREPVYNFLHREPAPLIERYLRREVSERVNFKGEILQAIDLEGLDREVDYLLSQGAEAIAICFLHAYVQPVHEIAAHERIRKRYPALSVSLSHQIAAEWREYERTSTTVLNSFIQPTVRGYLDRLRENLKTARYESPLAIMQSSGGVVDARTAAEKPIRTMMSGPAGGVIGAKVLCDELGHRNVICTDVGGTTYDVAIIEDGRILERSETHIARRPIIGSLIDIISIGAGGGSVAWLDHRNGLQVGPRSAGAVPGPACFNRGGAEPTVTDAHLILGRLDPEYFLGGRLQLDREAARKAIAERIAAPLGLDTTKAAQGIVAIAETNMANAIRKMTVERGLDPREFVLLAYGGGGGLFACAVAAELGVPRVIVPNSPANFSAWGILCTDYMDDEVRTRVMPFDAQHVGEALETLTTLESRAKSSIESYGFNAADIRSLRRLDMRFRGQEYTLTIDLEQSWCDLSSILSGARERFVEAHRRLYGHGDPDAALELVSVRCRAIGPVRKPIIGTKQPGSHTRPSRQRAVFFTELGCETMTNVLDRDSIPQGKHIAGPVIIEEWTMTTVVPPGWSAQCDQYRNLIFRPQAGG